ncbi:hypothetical protein K3495_g9546 [Podosphaera aphanis]|nr:hypothetical protein K3495_g9546 [Podosphaera aphanis]
MCAFSDGSSNGPGRSAFGFAIYRNEELITTGKGSLLEGEVFDAEIVGALRASEATLKIVRNMPIKVLLDNQEAYKALVKGLPRSSYTAHNGIEGNEKVDEMARAALAQLPPEEARLATPDGRERTPTLTFAALGRHINIRAQELVESWWRANRPKRYEELDL